MPTLNFKHLIIIFFTLIFSCAKDDKQAKIRLVDLQGRPKSVITHVPELNSNLMAVQDRNKMIGQVAPVSNNAPMISQKDIAAQYDVAPNNNFGNIVAKEVQKTMQQGQAQTPAVNAASTTALALDEVKRENEEVVEYDLSEGEKPAKKADIAKVKKVKQDKKIVVSKAGKGLFVQVGSFSSITNAKNTLEKMQKFHKGKIEEVADEQTIYRVLLGPFANKNQARNMVKSIKNSGHDAIIVRNK